MRVRYDPFFIEQAVCEAIRHDPRLEARLHRAIDPLYGIEDKRKKAERFQETYMAFFQSLQLEGVVAKLLCERPLLTRAIDQCIVRPTPAPGREAAELYVKQDDGLSSCVRTLFILACPRSLLDPDGFAGRMRRDLLQTEDMIDERFGYKKDSLAGRSPRQNLMRDRFRVLWALYTEGRLAPADQWEACTVRTLRAWMKRVFPGFCDRRLSAAFDRVSQAGELNHDQILEWAAGPERLVDADDHTSPKNRQAAGEPCPVCAFSTHDWSDQEDLHAVRTAVQRDFPTWRPEAGLCRQCAEIYGAARIEVS